jgi:hypothetical protein
VEAGVNSVVEAAAVGAAGAAGVAEVMEAAMRATEVVADQVLGLVVDSWARPEEVYLAARAVTVAPERGAVELVAVAVHSADHNPHSLCRELGNPHM